MAIMGSRGEIGMKMKRLSNSFFRFPLLLQLFILVIILICSFGVQIHMIEPETFPTVLDGIWWSIVTASTVGFGDFVPESAIGRIVAMLLIFIGGGFVTFYMVTLAAHFVRTRDDLKTGRLAAKASQHLIIVGWNERSRNIVTHIAERDERLDIVLIDKTARENPAENLVHFIHGDPSEDRILQKANIQKAETLLITADQHLSEKDADMQSTLTLLAAKALNPDLYAIVEMLTREQLINAWRAGADEMIETANLISLTMVNSIFSHGISTTLVDVLNHLQGNKLTFEEAAEEMIGLTFPEAHHTLFLQETLLIGLKKGETVYMNPSSTVSIEKNDQLIMIRS